MKEHYLKKALLIVMIAAGVFIRLQMAWFHFVHYDDVGIAVSYLRDNDGLNFLWKRGWTYAPLQIIFSTAFLSEQNSYITNLFISRIPSAVCGILSIIAIYILIKRMYCRKESESKTTYLPLLAAALITFSWQNIIYSAQAEPYTIGVLFVTIILLFFSYESEFQHKSFFICLSVIMGILCYGQYQIFIFVFTYYLACFWDCLIKKEYKALLHYLLASIGSLLLTVPILLKIITLGLLSRGTNWNVGPENCYLFTWPNSNFGEGIEYIFTFFIKNIYLLYENFFVSNKENLGVHLSAIILLLLSILGAIFLQKRKDRKLKVFVNLSFLLILIMIVLGKLTLSPSRHMMVMFPFMILLICEGIVSLGKLWSNKTIGNKLTLALVLAIMLVFFLDYPTEFSKRKMILDEKTIKERVEEYQPDIICAHGYFFAINMMNFPGYTNITDSSLPEMSYYVKSQEQANTRIMFVGGGPVSEESINKLIKDIREKEQTELSPSSEWSIIYNEEEMPKSATEYSKSWGEWGNGKQILVYDVKSN